MFFLTLYFFFSSVLHLWLSRCHTFVCGNRLQILCAALQSRQHRRPALSRSVHTGRWRTGPA